MRLRGKSIRRKIVTLLAVPLVSLACLWAFATYLTLDDARHLRGHSRVMDTLGYPAERAVEALQLERRQAMVYLADPRRSDALTALQQQQQVTDEAVDTIRRHAGDGDVGGDLSGGHHRALHAVLEALDDLPRLRQQVADNTVTRSDAFEGYNGVLDPSFRFLSELHALGNEMDGHGRAVIALQLAREYLSREDALMAGALAAGHMTREEQRGFADRVAERNLVYQVHLPQLPEDVRRSFEDYWRSAEGRALRDTEEAVIAAAAPHAVRQTNADLWESATTAVLDELRRLDKEAVGDFHDRLAPAGRAILVKVVIAGVLGAIALVASLIISVRIGRGLVRDLSALRKEAHESAAVRLPNVMRRLAAGDTVDVETEAPRLEYEQNELGQVGQALSTLRRAAIEAAVKQAELRKGISDVFVNLARRNQVLLHRQLTLLDAMERRTEDADELADLFKLDHLTTRMRRHAEGLVILSGAAPSRQWSKPIQLMDVVRGAVAEVEDYERVEVRRLPKLAVDGAAVADLTHLIAELIENATVFSPPHTAVQVQGERVPSGFTLEIHDRGLGMSADALLEANLRLAETPEFELSDTDRLGLFVVSRLAQRHGVRVSLKESPYGGTTAVVLIPNDLLSEASDEDRAGGGPKRRDTGALETTDAGLPRRPVGGRTPGARTPGGGRAAGPADRSLDGPVELEAPLTPEEEAELPACRRADTASRSTPSGDAAPREAAPAGEQHQQTPDRTAPEPARAAERPAEPIPLTRRRGAAHRPEHGSPVVPLERRADRGRSRRTERSGGETAGTRPGADTTTDAGLPRRVRNVTLARLRAEEHPAEGPARDDARPTAPAAPSSPGGGRGDDWVDDRDADEVRARMAALQRGWQRGREHQERPRGEDRPAPGPGDGGGDGPRARDGDRAEARPGHPTNLPGRDPGEA